MKHKYKITDATKDELIQYFFGVEGFGGGYRVPADKDRFLIWLENKRCDALLKANETATEASDKALKEYIGFIRLANEEGNVDKKLELLDKANAAYERYEKFNEQWGKSNREIDKHFAREEPTPYHEKICRTCVYGDKPEYDKPCIVYSDDCKLYVQK